MSDEKHGPGLRLMRPDPGHLGEMVAGRSKRPERDAGREADQLAARRYERIKLGRIRLAVMTSLQTRGEVNLKVQAAAPDLRDGHY